MSDLQIVRPRLAFESEFGQHRNWWVRDSRIAGNPLSALLYLLSHDPSMMPTQTEARKELGFGKDAWISAKKRLLEAGFIIEVRDRYPHGFLDAAGRPKGGQKRYRLFLQDPEPRYSIAEHLAVLEFDEPYESFLAANEGNRVGFSEPVKESPDQCDGGLSAVCGPPASGNPNPADNPPSFKEEKTKPNWLVGSIADSNQPTDRAAGAREAEIDVGIAALHPELRLTFAHIFREVNGRVDLDLIDVVRAVEDTVIRAAQRGDRVADPARYVGTVIVRNPQNYLLGTARSEAFAPIADAASGSTPAADCLAGNHWWGSEVWAEIDRSHCVHCGHARRTIDKAFADLEVEMSSIGGGN